MKRWVVVLLVLLAAIILVSPGIVGHLAERNLESNLEWAAEETGELTVTGGSFDRGWFTSEGTRRIEIRNPQLRAVITGLAEVPETGTPPALVVSTRLDHGLIPVGSMTRDSGSLAPALASAVSTLALDPGNGETIAIPGTIMTRFGLTGSSTSRYELDTGSFDEDGTLIEWHGAEVSVQIDPAEGSFRFEGDIMPMSLETAEDDLSIGRVVFDGEQAATEHGFNAGSVNVEVGWLTITTPDLVTGRIIDLRVETSTELNGDRVGFRSAITLAGADVAGIGNVIFDIDMTVKGLDARSVQAILAAVEQAETSATPDEALAGVYPKVQDDLQRILAAGPEIHIERGSIVLPQGRIGAQLHLDLAETDRAAFSWPGVLLALEGSADVTVAAALVEMWQAKRSEGGALVAMGFLEKEGDVYRMQAGYAKGLLTVNGAPMPIPLPAAAR